MSKKLMDNRSEARFTKNINKQIPTCPGRLVLQRTCRFFFCQNIIAVRYYFCVKLTSTSRFFAWPPDSGVATGGPRTPPWLLTGPCLSAYALNLASLCLKYRESQRVGTTPTRWLLTAPVRLTCGPSVVLDDLFSQSVGPLVGLNDSQPVYEALSWSEGPIHCIESICVSLAWTASRPSGPKVSLWGPQWGCWPRSCSVWPSVRIWGPRKYQ